MPEKFNVVKHQALKMIRSSAVLLMDDRRIAVRVQAVSRILISVSRTLIVIAHEYTYNNLSFRELRKAVLV
jgi:hypothetical protein